MTHPREWKNNQCWAQARCLYLAMKEFEYERQLEDKQNGNCEDKQNGQNTAEDGPFRALIFPELPVFIFQEIGEYAEIRERKWFGTIDFAMRDFLDVCFKSEANLLISLYLFFV